jgi:hypothetical protein
MVSLMATADFARTKGILGICWMGSGKKKHLCINELVGKGSHSDSIHIDTK